MTILNSPLPRFHLAVPVSDLTAARQEGVTTYVVVAPFWVGEPARLKRPPNGPTETRMFPRKRFCRGPCSR